MAFSANGKRALTGSMDHTAKVFDIQSGKELATFRGHTEPLYGAVFSPDGKHVLTGSYDHTARIWDAANGRELHVLKGHTDRVIAVAFSPDGTRVLTLSMDRTARLWDAHTGKILRVLKDHGYARQTVAFSRDYTRILTCSNDSTARLWDAQLGAEIHILKGHKGRITAAAFAPDGKRVVTGGADHSARLWNAETGKELHELKCQAGVISVAFSADGKQVLTGSADHSARFWDAETGKLLSSLKCPGDTISLAFSADGKQVLTGSKDQSARLWDVEGNKVLQTLKCPGEVHAVAISADGKRLLTGSVDRQARLWDAESGKLLHTVPGGSSVAFAPDGKHVLTGGDDHQVHLFDTQTGKPVFAIRGHLKNQTAALFSADGKYIIVEDDLTRLWDARTGKPVCRLISFGGTGGWAVVDGAGRYDASNGGDVVGLHWVVHNEPVALNQLKDRYYEPGLLAKHLGFNKEPLRDVKSFRDVKLYPEMVVAQADPKKPQFQVDLKNTGGGIGKVVVLVNGKELTGDARPPDAKPDQAKLDVQVDLTKDPRVVPGRKNKVEVLAYNGEGNLTSRGLVREFDGPGAMVEEPKSLHAVVIGVSQYSGEKLNLHFAAKDAEDMAAALRLAAGRLFPEKAYVTVLTTVGTGDKPTRANILKALEALRATKPADTVVVYLAGHGVAHGGQDGDGITSPPMPERRPGCRCGAPAGCPVQYRTDRSAPGDPRAEASADSGHLPFRPRRREILGAPRCPRRLGASGGARQGPHRDAHPRRLCSGRGQLRGVAVWAGPAHVQSADGHARSQAAAGRVRGCRRSVRLRGRQGSGTRTRHRRRAAADHRQPARRQLRHRPLDDRRPEQGAVADRQADAAAGELPGRAAGTRRAGAVETGGLRSGCAQGRVGSPRAKLVFVDAAAFPGAPVPWDVTRSRGGKVAVNVELLRGAQGEGDFHRRGGGEQAG